MKPQLPYSHIISLFFALCFIQCSQKYAGYVYPFPKEVQLELDTFSYYHSLESCVNISPIDFPTQIARFTIDRPGLIQKITLHLDGDGVGQFTTHIYGHESGTNYPALLEDLVEPIIKEKKKKGYEAIEIKLKRPVCVINDQFYIALDNFTGDFGLKQDSTFYQEYCCSRDGGNYYPTLLKNTENKYLGENCYATIDVAMAFLPKPAPIFEDITAEAGIALNLNNESIAWGDIDGDTWVDLLVGRKLYQNNKGKFEDITAKKQIAFPGWLMGSAFIDMDNDGDLDIMMMGSPKSILFINDGKGQFAAQNLAIPRLYSLHGYSIGDINGDKYPDLIIAQLWEPYPVPRPNFLFLNTRKNDFEDITKRLYPQHNGEFNFPDEWECITEVDSTYFSNYNKNRRSRGTQFTDVDLDGDIDLYITNYFLERDEFYENDGNGFFTSLPTPKPLEQSDTMDNHGTGVDWYDYDNDGDFDLLLPQLAHPRNIDSFDHRGTTLFRNDNGQFRDSNPVNGIQYEETHAGATFGDVNNDGLVDIFTTLYYGCRFVDLYLQQADYSFVLSTYQSGFYKVNTGNDACFVDYNNDGRLDLATGNKGKFRLYKNRKSNENRWLKLQLVAQSMNRIAIGARVKVYTDEQILMQEVNAGRGQKMQKPSWLHFGLGKAEKIKKVEVYWSNKQAEQFLEIETNQSYILTEGGSKKLVSENKKQK